MDSDLIAFGADLQPETLLNAYRAGLFPMPRASDAEVSGGNGLIRWWSPDPRGILPLDEMKISRSLAKSRRKFSVTVDKAFCDVIDGCADPSRPHGWINQDFREAYVRLHELGWAHSVEVWTRTKPPEAPALLVGGLYGVAIGGFFAAESKFHRATDASKVAVAALVDILREEGAELLDIQWQTPHLEKLGAIEVSREEYLLRLESAVKRPLPQIFTSRSQA